MKRISLYRISLVWAVLLFAHSFAHGYSYWACDGTKVDWNSDTVTIRAGAVTFAEGDPYRTALAWVISRLNQNPSDFEFNLSYGDTSLSRSNDQNEIWASTNPDYLQDEETGDWYPAVAWTRRTCGSNPRIIESDVVFNADRTWTSGTTKWSMTAYGGSARPFRTTAMHELGHALGLAHVNTEYNIMGSDTNCLQTNGNDAYAYFGEDASHGAVFLYGADSSSPEDVSVVHWRYKGTNGEYSTHERTDIQDSAGNTLTSFTTDDEPFFYVDNGETIKVQFTYENNGTTTFDSVDVGFYLSTDDTITTLDEYLTTKTIGSFSRSNVYTTYHTVTLPSDLQPSRYYYIGAIIDCEDSIDEVLESNNATYIGLYTKTFPTSTPTNTPTFQIYPLNTPTPTPTRIINILRTPTPTPTMRIARITPTIPAIFQTPVVIPVGTPIPFPTDYFIPDFLEINPRFDYRSVILPETLSVFKDTELPEDPDRGFQIVPNFRMGPGAPLGMNHSVSLPGGVLMSTAYMHGERQPVLVSISEDGGIGSFARVQLSELQIGGKTIAVDAVNVLSMSFDGSERFTILMKVFGMDAEEERYIEVAVRTTITGPFQEAAAIRDFSLH